MIWYPPILTYHRVHPEIMADTPSVFPKTFERQIALLSRYWKPISLSALVSCLAQKASPPRNGVVVTFDDGTADHFIYAYPILKNYRIPAILFVITDNIGKEGFLNHEQIRTMQQSGIAFGSHTARHAYLPSLTLENIRRELVESKRSLEGLGVRVEFLSYPAGGFTPDVAEAARTSGYRAACTTNRGMTRFPIDRWALRRVTMHERATTRLGMWIRCSGYYGLNKRLRRPA